MYISEQILKSHKDELKEILDSFSDRVTVAYYDIIEREEKEAPYKVVKDWFLYFVAINSPLLKTRAEFL